MASTVEPLPTVAPERYAALAVDVGTALARHVSLPAGLDACCRAVVRNLDAAFARVWTLNEREAVLELQASAGMYTHIDGPHARVPVGAFKIGRIAERRAPHLTNDVQHDPQVGDREWARRESLVSFAGYPLIVEERLVGVIAMFARRPLPDVLIDTLKGVADLVAVGIERKRGEERLRQSEARYAQILDSVRDMIFCKDKNLVVTYANKAACEYYGLTPDQLRGVTDVPFNTRDFTAQYVKDDLAVFETGQPIETPSEPNRDRNGETRTFYTVKTPIRDESGEVVELVGVARDVTERRRLEAMEAFLSKASAAIAESIEYEQTLRNVAHMAVPEVGDWCAVDLVVGREIRRLAVAHVDPAKVEMAHELQRRWPAKLDDPGGAALVLRTGESQLVSAVDEALVAASIADPEMLPIVRGLGLRSWMIVPLKAHDQTFGTITFVTAESERSYGAAELALAENLASRAAIAIENARLYEETRRAVAARDQALAEVQRLNAELERRVVERTAQLTEANAELEAFSYSVSHDLRAPIRHVSGFIDLLRAHAGATLDAKGKRYLDTIGASAQQMGVLIDALLGFSRLGRSELNRRPIELDTLISQVRRDLEPDMRDRKLEWRVAPLPAVMGDPTTLQLVFTNLLSNAVKYTQAKERATIDIGVVPGGAPGEVTIAVKDDGIGFDMRYVHKLFGVFQRLHAAHAYEGTGIGLATVRRIVLRHGGKVWAEGQEGEGATFYVTLPGVNEPQTSKGSSS